MKLCLHCFQGTFSLACVAYETTKMKQCIVEAISSVHVAYVAS
jgi:hypothetical protein